VSEAFLRRLKDAGLVVTGPAGPGASESIIWRARGVAVTQHWDELVEASWRAVFPELRRNASPLVEPEARYRSIFPEYANVVGVTDARGTPSVIRADNLTQVVPRLVGDIDGTVVLSTGGLLRRLDGPARPLFRDAWIWPAFQVNQIVRSSETEQALRSHRTVLAQVLSQLGLASFAVRLREPGHYGSYAELTCTTLPTGRPTVLATTYLMAARYRERLGVSPDHALIDVGFTGKALAVAAMNHADTGGLALPPALAPEQIAILTDQPGAAPVREVEDRLRRFGARTSTTTVRGNRATWTRAWRRARRYCASLGLAESAGTWFGMAREHTTWDCLGEDVIAAALWADRSLARCAQRQLDRSRRRMTSSLDELLTHGCPSCRSGHDTGWVMPHVPGTCPGCGNATNQALPDTFGRFY
jgi:hypothetical protein